AVEQRHGIDDRARLAARRLHEVGVQVTAPLGMVGAPGMDQPGDLSHRRYCTPSVRRRSWLPGLLATLVFTAPAWLPFLRPDLSLWQLYDGGNHLRKAFFLAQLIKDGSWYPRWVPQAYGGYGYPTFNFSAPA